MTKQTMKQRVAAITIAWLLFLSVFTVLGAVANAAPLNGWQKKDGSWYYYKNNVKQTGWLRDNGVWYYLHPSHQGEMMRDGFYSIDGYQYFLTGSGRLIQNGWHRIKDGNLSGWWIKAYASGVLIEGWHKEGGNWYYLNPLMYTGGTADIDGVIYFFHNSGVCQTKEGWFRRTDTEGLTEWYYAEAGGALKKGWFKYYNKWYYLEPRMSTGGSYEINGKSYRFDENGAWVP